MQVRNDLPDNKVIVGVTRDSQIHTGMMAFHLVATGLFDKMISLAEAKFMSMVEGTHESWTALLTQQPLFGLDENNVPCCVEGGYAQPKAAAPEAAVP